MKKKKIPQFLIMGLCGAVLVGCSTNGGTDDTPSSDNE